MFKSTKNECSKYQMLQTKTHLSKTCNIWFSQVSGFRVGLFGFLVGKSDPITYPFNVQVFWYSLIQV
ncbi:hypothetical protein HanIR_Chr03g0132621 [Helianthus annuus]|nr:hypothetical protein HanIR_Chr03g0132621 [Helianthus annuus]